MKRSWLLTLAASFTLLLPLLTRAGDDPEQAEPMAERRDVVGNRESGIGNREDSAESVTPADTADAPALTPAQTESESETPIVLPPPPTDSETPAPTTTDEATESSIPLAGAVIKVLGRACDDMLVGCGQTIGQFFEQLTGSLSIERYRAAMLDSVREGNKALKLASKTRTRIVAQGPKIAEPKAPEPDLTPLRAKIHQAVEYYRQRPLNTAQQGNWEIMHRIVAYGMDTQVRRDGPNGAPVNAIDWLLMGNRSHNEPLMVLNGGRPECRVGPGLQGHPGQFLGMLAQSNVPATTRFRLGNRMFTVTDLIEQEKAECSSTIELTFKLIGLSHYLPSDETWVARDGQRWSISRLVQEDIQQPLRQGACGGTHRLFGLTSAYQYRQQQGLPIDGEFRRAQTYIRDYHRYTLGALQNPDGSFSTDWFTKPANDNDPARKVQTTGHITEWLVYSLPDDELRDPRVIKAVDYLATQLTGENKDWSIGPLGHALHALIIYDNRLTASDLPKAPTATASPTKRRVAR